MSNQHYNWQRFWCPRGSTINLGDGGYLYDPQVKYGNIYNPNVVPFCAIATFPCLVLLGEPGIGKSYTIHNERDAINAQVVQAGGEILWLDLRSVGSESRLDQKLFNNPKFIAWTQGAYHLHVFLDSLDEALVRIDTLASILLDELKNYSVDRLSLRLACRTADWPSSLEEGLNKLWGKDQAGRNNVGVFELAPLRRVDVQEVAKANNVDADAFLQEIEQKEAIPLAIKPVTLNFLLKTYQRVGQLPSTQAELYLDGCRILCEEQTRESRDARLTGSLTARQRLIVAARIAAVTVFANRYAVWTGQTQGDVAEEDVTIEALFGGSEQVNRDRFQVSEAAIRETLATGLFSARGADRIGWAHQTYAEFLAAWYLVQHNMPVSQIMNLLTHAGDAEGKLIPQLHETAAWLAGMQKDVFYNIMQVDSLVLLRSDVATTDAQDRAALAEALLKLYDEEKALYSFLSFNLYRKLIHPNLAQQLEPYIRDTTKGWLVRRVAINIAEACQLQTLEDALLEVALDSSQEHRTRVQAAYAITRIGSNKAKAQLKPLALGQAGDDPDDELKGCGLSAVWPNYVTVQELLNNLTPLKRTHIGGSYNRFIRFELTQKLQPSDLPLALEWVAQQRTRYSSHDSIGQLTNAIMLQASQQLEAPGVLEVFAKAAWLRLKHQHKILSEDDINDQLSL